MWNFLTRTHVSAAGAGLAAASAVLFLLMFGLELLGLIESPYIGLAVYVALPLGLIIGLLLVPVGNWLDRRAVPHAAWPRIDLNLPQHRRIVIGTVASCFVSIVIVALGLYGGVHAMETNTFCGQVCHQVMHPQYAAYQNAPHSSVDCVACHVGGGAGATARSKLRGTRQLVEILSDTYPRPVGRPVRDMRPARETCETCHWPEKYHGDKLRTVREYADDEENTESVTQLRVHVGGGSDKLGIAEGIHWHMNLSNQIEYIATDSTRQAIPYFKLTTRDGSVREYRVDGVTDEELAQGVRRRMDCMD